MADPTGTRGAGYPATVHPTAWPALDGARVVVTGAAGFVGGHLVRALLARGVRRVVAIDRRDVPPIVPPPGAAVEIVSARRDVIAPLADALDGADVVFHLAAHVDVPHSIRDPLADATANVLGTVALLESCRKAGVARVVFGSSEAVYGAPEYLPIDEQHPTRPTSPFGLAKLTAERYCLMYADLYGLSAVALRYFDVYGPGQPINGGAAATIARFVDRVRQEQPLLIEGDGTRARDFVHVRDVARANLLAAAARFTGVLNVGTGRPTSPIDLARLLGGGYPVARAPAHARDVYDSVAAVRAAREAIGFSAEIALEEGLAELRPSR